MGRFKAGWVVSGFASLALVVGVGACGGAGDDGGGEDAGMADTASAGAEAVAPVAVSTVAESYAPELGVELGSMQKTDGGMYWEVVSEGSGEVAEAGDTVRVHYTGWLPSGEKFDSSRDRGEPFQFMLGARRVIEGWDVGVAGMKVGERRKLVIPPSMGYGAAGAGDLIPPNSTLVFDVELLEIE